MGASDGCGVADEVTRLTFLAVADARFSRSLGHEPEGSSFCEERSRHLDHTGLLRTAPSSSGEDLGAKVDIIDRHTHPHREMETF